MEYHLFIKKGFFLAVAFFLLLALGCTEAKEPPKKVVKKKIIQTQPTPPSKAVKMPAPAQKEEAIPARKAEPAPEKAIDTKKSPISSKTIEEKPPEEIKKPLVPTKAEEKAEAAKVAKLTEIPYVYNPKGRIDPFKPFITEVKVVPVKKGVRRAPLTPLERIDLSQFKVVAILSAAKEKFAMVEDAAGKGYVIRIGTYIGKSGGKVADIFQDHFVVEEEFVDIYGEKKTKRIPLKLRKGPGAGGQP